MGSLINYKLVGNDDSNISQPVGGFETWEDAAIAALDMLGWRVCEEGEGEEEENQPEDELREGDFVISDGRSKHWAVGVHEGRFLGEFDTYSEARRAIEDKMDADQFWPNVWDLSDHGNLSLAEPCTEERFGQEEEEEEDCD